MSKHETKRSNQYARPWTPAEDHQVVNLHREGISNREIAGHMGRSKDAIGRAKQVVDDLKD